MKSRFTSFIQHRLLGNRDFQKFIIVSRPRSGSEWLVSLLNSHPNCITRGEIFRYPTKEAAKKMFDKQFNRNWNSSINAVGFKIFYHHPLASNDLTVWKLIKEDPSIKIIQLIRRNWIRVFISEEIGKKNNQWILKDNSKKKNEKIKVDIDSLANFLENNKKLLRVSHFINLQETHEIFNIYYEDMVSDLNNEMVKLLKFIGLDCQELVTLFRKQNPEPLSALITNYSEVKEFLLKSNNQIFIE